MLLSRRSVAGGLMLGLPAAGAFGAPGEGAEPAQRSPDSASDAQTAGAIRGLTEFLRTWDQLAVLPRIREVQALFLRSTQKYPDYIEIGFGVWNQLYDWHIRTQQPLTIAVLANGRYAITTLMSTFVLRVDADREYVGPGDDTLQ